MTRLYKSTALAVAVVLALIGDPPTAEAQVDPANFRLWNVADGDFSNPNSWDDPGFAPPEARFGEGATIDNMGTANVTGIVDSSANPGTEATPGELRVSDGVLNITSTGQLRIVADATQAGPPIGAAAVTGAGVLRVASGGIFEAESLSLTGAFEPQITGPSFNPLDITGGAGLSGPLNVTFSGFTPTTSDSWRLVQASALSGGFSSITTSGATLQPGQVFGVRNVDAGGGDVAAELFIDQLLTLEVNRQTGEVTMLSETGTVDIDSYRIRSAAGVLDDTSAVFNSLQDQVGNSWRESNLSVNQLGELQQAGTTTVTGTGFSLGNVYSSIPTAFRDPSGGIEDLVFDFSSPDGVERTGIVNYVGAPNDLVLTVDPTDGRVQISNPSGFVAEIDAYSISSDSGELITANWSSLDDADGAGNDDGGWRESNPSANFLGELLQTGTETLTGSTKFQLGEIYDFTAGSEDLIFEFALAGSSENFIGTVLYAELAEPGSLPGDFNADNIVNAVDYALWRDNLGGDASVLNGNGSGAATVVTADYTLWNQNFGATAGALAAPGSVATPEPSSLLLATLGLLAANFRFPCRQRVA